jgi:anti-sigma-K factor RskA
MTDPTSTPDMNDLDSLLGAYALDALDVADRARVDAYLEHNSAARAEVDEMRETAASLALLPDTPAVAPPELWTRIEQVITADRTDTSVASPAAPVDELAVRRAARRNLRWIVPATAAAAIAVVLLAAQVVSLQNRLDQARSLGSKATAAAFERAAKAPGARALGLRSESGATLARVVLLPDGSGYLRGDHLDPLPAQRTYQLWALTGNAKAPTAVSAGVLGPSPSAVSFRASGPVHGFAVTVEPAGGVVQSHNTPIAVAQLS